MTIKEKLDEHAIFPMPKAAISDAIRKLLNETEKQGSDLDEFCFALVRGGIIELSKFIRDNHNGLQ